VQPTEGSQIPGIRRWPAAYLPKIFDPSRVDRIIDIDQAGGGTDHPRPGGAGGHLRRHLLRRGGGGGAAAVREVENAVIVAIVCDRGDRYLSTNVFPAE
jgi:S-sulfo-L-cysteine synthase (O-acetyl-L-serine-dependent)